MTSSLDSGLGTEDCAWAVSTTHAKVQVFQCERIFLPFTLRAFKKEVAQDQPSSKGPFEIPPQNTVENISKSPLPARLLSSVLLHGPLVIDLLLLLGLVRVAAFHQKSMKRVQKTCARVADPGPVMENPKAWLPAKGACYITVTSLKAINSRKQVFQITGPALSRIN